MAFANPMYVCSSFFLSSDDILTMERHSDDHLNTAFRTYAVNTFRESALGPDDARVLLHRSPWVYTSPNLSVIPTFDPNPCELRARNDGRFGLEDYICHPQGHSEAYPWAPCIPRCPITEEAREVHPYALCWCDLTTENWVAPVGCAFTWVGTLDLAPYTDMFLLAVEVNTRAVSMYSNQAVPQEMVTAARALFSTLDRLKSLPLGFRDLVLQWTQVQRLLLDLVAMESYYGHFSNAMMQREKRYPVNLGLMGCFTTSPAIVENMFWAGVPVVYVRTDTHPNAWNIRKFAVANSFWVPPDVETEEWTDGSPCRTLWFASQGTDRIKMSRPFGRYFEDIPALPSAPSSQPGHLFPTPPPPATAATPQYDNPMPDSIYRQDSPSPPHDMMDYKVQNYVDSEAELGRASTPQPGSSSTPAGRPDLVENSGVVKLSRAEKKKQAAGK